MGRDDQKNNKDKNKKEKERQQQERQEKERREREKREQQAKKDKQNKPVSTPVVVDKPQVHPPLKPSGNIVTPAVPIKSPNSIHNLSDLLSIKSGSDITLEPGTYKYDKPQIALPWSNVKLRAPLGKRVTFNSGIDVRGQNNEFFSFEICDNEPIVDNEAGDVEERDRGVPAVLVSNLGNKFHNLVLRHCSGHGISGFSKAFYAYGLLVSDCGGDKWTHGAYINGEEANVFESCVFTGNSSTGLTAHSKSIVSHVIIENCMFYGNGRIAQSRELDLGQGNPAIGELMYSMVVKGKDCKYAVLSNDQTKMRCVGNHIFGPVLHSQNLIDQLKAQVVTNPICRVLPNIVDPSLSYLYFANWHGRTPPNLPSHYSVYTPRDIWNPIETDSFPQIENGCLIVRSL